MWYSIPITHKRPREVTLVIPMLDKKRRQVHSQPNLVDEPWVNERHCLKDHGEMHMKNRMQFDPWFLHTHTCTHTERVHT